jgi:DMSO reductase anchor subunit
MVQLLIYPSFAFYNPKDLLAWHEKYTRRIAVIVIPLMFGQLIVTTAQFVQEQGFYEILSMAMILLLWMITFAQFVPLHKSLSNGEEIAASVQKLVNRNWTRTTIWTALFALTVWNYFIA